MMLAVPTHCSVRAQGRSLKEKDLKGLNKNKLVSPFSFVLAPTILFYHFYNVLEMLRLIASVSRLEKGRKHTTITRASERGRQTPG